MDLLKDTKKSIRLKFVITIVIVLIILPLDSIITQWVFKYFWNTDLSFWDAMLYACLQRR